VRNIVCTHTNVSNVIAKFVPCCMSCALLISNSLFCVFCRM